MIKTILHPGRVVERTQDVEPTLELNKSLQNEQQRSDWGRHVASVPCVLLLKWMDEYYANTGRTLKLFSPEMDAIVEKKLKDPEWAYLRTDKRWR